MAVLGKIRSKGTLLVGVIALGLFSFIAEEAFRSCESTRNESRQQVGEVLGQKISVQDFQSMIEEYTNVLKMTQGVENLNDEQLNQVKDQIWQQYVNETIIAAEAEKLGLTVTDEELTNVINQGTNQMLLSTPFVNQQTGRFDAQALKKFIADYKKLDKTNPQLVEQYEGIYKYWQFIEKNLRSTLLTQKYQGLLAGCLLSNPVSAKMAFEGRSNEASIELAALPYSSVNDNDVKPTDAQIKAKYNELKEMFRQMEETRNVKYVSYQVVASAADRKAMNKVMSDAAEQLQAADANIAEIVRKAGSVVSYTGTALSKTSLPSDIAAQLDSMAVGQVKNLGENKGDNTLNVVKLISKVQQADSVEYRQIQIGGADIATARKTADSVYTALQAGADFEAIAKKYNQDGTKVWLTSRMYEGQTMDDNSKKLLNALLNGGVNAIQNLEFDGGNSIIQVTDRRNIVSKYDVAIVKKSVDFTKETYSKEYNKFSEFVSKCTDEKSLEALAKTYKYEVQETELSTTQHYVAGLRATREALKWAFDADKGDLSPLYECGNNDNLLVMVVTDVHPQGYRSLDDENLKKFVESEVIKDLKFEKVSAKLAPAKSIADAKRAGASVTTVDHVTFGAPVFVSATGASEPALSGAVAATKKGQFSSHVVKGNSGAYVFQVKDQNKSAAKFNAKEEEQKLANQAMQAAGRFTQELFQNAKVVDNRYLFF